MFSASLFHWFLTQAATLIWSIGGLQPTSDPEPASFESQVRVRPWAEEAGVVTSLDEQALRTRGATEVTTALSGVAGVRVENQCAVCNTTRIRLSGLPGDYTMVQVDGVPVVGTLGSSYALMQLDLNDLQRVDVMRGPSSVVQGTDAVAGVVNLVPMRGDDRGRTRVRATGGSFGYHRVSLFRAAESDVWGAPQLGVSVTGHNAVDRDGDQVSEFAGYRRLAASGSLSQPWSDGLWRMRVAWVQERRQGGVVTGRLLRDVAQPPIGADGFPTSRALTETILTDRLDVGSTLRLNLDGGHRAWLTAAGALHIQDSDYAGEIYEAVQWLGVVQQRFEWFLARRWWLDTGVSVRSERVDESVGPLRRIHQPGAFTRVRWAPAHWIDAAAGGRVDWNSLTGWMPMAEASMQLRPVHGLQWRTMVGQGVRVPTVFFEQFKGVRPQGYSLLNDRAEEERITQALTVVGWDSEPWGTLELEGGWSRIGQPVLLQTVEDADGLVAAVSLGTSELPVTVWHTGATAQLRPLWWLTLDMGGMHYVYDDPGRTFVIPPPASQLTATATFEVGRVGQLALVADYWGNVDLAGTFGDALAPAAGTTWREWVLGEGVGTEVLRARSPWTGTLRASWWQALGTRGWAWNLAVDNVLDTHQSDVEGPVFFTDPAAGASQLDVVRIWGPLRGRAVHVGVEWQGG